MLKFERVFCCQVSGKDAERYLHGRLTQDIKGLSSGVAKRSLMLTPQGRTLGSLIICRDNQNFFVIADNSEADSAKDEFQNALFQFKVADQVNLSFLNDIDVYLVSENEIKPEYEVKGEFAFSLVSDEKLFICVIKNLTIPLRDSYEAFRVKHAIPRFGLDFDEKTIASDLPLKHFVSFNKGCYAGQEVVEMSTARGRPNREFKLFSVSSGVMPGVEVFSRDQEKACGFITSVSKISDEDSLALGFVKYGVSLNSLYINGETIKAVISL